MVARFGYQYESEDVKLSLVNHDAEVTHSLAHGLRLSLQKLSRVTIREIDESVGSNHVDVFDAQEGGGAVARTLVNCHHGEYRSYQTVISFAEKQFDCTCDDGCTRCLYQNGCAKQYDPKMLAREGALALIEDGLDLVLEIE